MPDDPENSEEEEAEEQASGVTEIVDTDNTEAEGEEESISLAEFYALLDDSDSKLHRDARHTVNCVDTAVELRILADKIRELGGGGEVCDEQGENINRAVEETVCAAESVWPTDTMPDLIQLAQCDWDVEIKTDNADDVDSDE